MADQKYICETRYKTPVSDDIHSRGSNTADGSSLERKVPLGLSCSPTLTLLYLLGSPEAQDIVEGYRPHFRVRRATAKERALYDL